MSKTKTVYDLICQWHAEADCGGGIIEAPVFWGLVEEHTSDLHIIPGANAVVTAEGLENALRVFFETLGGVGYEPEYDTDTNMTNEDFERGLRAALEAAGIEVVDERTEIVSERVVLELTRVVPGDPNDDASTLAELHRGDTLYIKRGKNDE